jgi:plastocyanin
MPDRSQSVSTRLRISLLRMTSTGCQAFYLVCAHAPASTDDPAATGNIAGEVSITRKLQALKMRFRLYPGYTSIVPPPEEKRDDEYRNIVIYLKSVPWSPAAGASHEELQLRQRGETFIPHVLPVVAGSTVSFPNQDPIFHNVFSLSRARTFDLGRFPKGDSRSITFDQSGIVPVFCHLHSDMSAIILVLDNPYFIIPDAAGRYGIENIPAGRYTLVAWHERSEPVERQVEVTAGETLQLNITVPIDDEESSAR